MKVEKFPISGPSMDVTRTEKVFLENTKNFNRTQLLQGPIGNFANGVLNEIDFLPF